MFHVENEGGGKTVVLRAAVVIASAGLDGHLGAKVLLRGSSIPATEVVGGETPRRAAAALVKRLTGVEVREGPLATGWADLAAGPVRYEVAAGRRLFTTVFSSGFVGAVPAPDGFAWVPLEEVLRSATPEVAALITEALRAL